MATDPRHRPFLMLLLFTALMGLLPALFALALPEPAALAGAYFGWTMACYLAAAGGPLLAATTFAPGEAMRAGWLALAASYVVLVPARLLAGVNPQGLLEGGGRHPGPVALLGLASGALGTTAFLLLARSWRQSGLDLTTPRSRVLMRLGALAVAVATAGPDVVERLPAALQGDVTAITDVITDLFDGALLVVAVPVLRAALALGGGIVAWPWGLLTLSLLAWLGYDAAATWGAAVGLSPRADRVVVEVFRALGAITAYSAGVAQRWVMQPAPGTAELEEPPAA